MLLLEHATRAAPFHPWTGGHLQKTTQKLLKYSRKDLGAINPNKFASESPPWPQTSLEDAAHRYKVPVALLSAYFSDRTAEFVLDNAIPDFSEDRLRKVSRYTSVCSRLECNTMLG